MANNKYAIKYSTTYIKQFNNILKYVINDLNNKIAAENFYNIKEVKKNNQKNLIIFFVFFKNSEKTL